MDDRKRFGEAIRTLRRARGLNQGDLAAALEVEQPAISKIENGRQSINDTQMRALADTLGVPVHELWAMAEDARPTAVREPGVTYAPDPQVRSVPLIGWIQAGQWTDTGATDLPFNARDYVITAAKVTEHAFALEVEGESMVNPRGEPSFPPGSRIIVEPATTATPGSLVIAQVDGERETTFKRLMSDGDRHYLLPLNPQFPAIPIDRDTRICGLVIARAEHPLT